MPSSSSGLGHRPLKAEITGSNPVGGISKQTKNFTYFLLTENVC